MPSASRPICKRVRYFRLISADALALGPLPRGTRERCWFGVDDVPTIPLVNEALRPLLLDALSMETE